LLFLNFSFCSQIIQWAKRVGTFEGTKNKLPENVAPLINQCQAEQDFIDLICNILRKKVEVTAVKKGIFEHHAYQLDWDSSRQREYFSLVHHNNYKRYVCDIMLQSLALSVSPLL
jgi:hypothetical protein